MQASGLTEFICGGGGSICWISVWGGLIHIWRPEIAVSCDIWRRQWHPLQHSCLENPRDGGAWWAAVHGVVTERLPFHFSLSRIGAGNGNPLQCSCLENPRDRGAWWAAVYGVAQSQTRLKQRGSSSSDISCL